MSRGVNVSRSHLAMAFASQDDAFPDVDPGIRPFGSLVLVQIRGTKSKTEGGIIIPDDVRDTEKWNTQVGMVRALGPVAFRHRTSMEPWPEGAWCNSGDFVRVPKFGGDKWQVDRGADEPALFCLFKDLDILGLVTGDPLRIRAFI